MIHLCENCMNYNPVYALPKSDKCQDRYFEFMKGKRHSCPDFIEDMDSIVEVNEEFEF